MRDYGKISPQFWTGDTGRAIRKAGRDAQVVAIYLISCPSSNMIGLYYLPLPTLCHEVGLTTEGASKALRSLFEAQFASWDAPSEHVFVVEMAAHQIGQRLERGDKRVKAVIREWQSMRKSPFYRDFWTRYSTAFHLPEPSPFDAPSMPLRSQEHEHEHEHEQEQDSSCSEPSSTTPREPKAAEPIAENFPAVDCSGPVKSWRMTAAKLFEWRETFATVDVDAEVRKAIQWLRDNPGRRKTAGGMPKFIGAWLTKATNDGRTSPAANGAAKPKRPRFPEWSELEKLNTGEKTLEDFT